MFFLGLKIICAPSSFYTETKKKQKNFENLKVKTFFENLIVPALILWRFYT